MARARRRSDDDDDDLPPPPGYVAPPDQCDNPRTAAQVQAVLDAFDDVPPIDDAVRLTLQRWLYRRDKYLGGGGAGHITTLLRIFLESDINRDALIEPILSGVSFCAERFAYHGLALLDAFDTIKLTELLATMRSLDLFPERELSSNLGIAVRNKIARILEPPIVEQPKPKLEPKPPASVTRISVIERNIALGLKLLALKAQSRRNNDYSVLRKKHFPDVETQHGCDLARVAKVYGERRDIWSRLAWASLVELAAKSMPASVRAELEARILAGETVTAPQIRHARGQLKGGSPEAPTRSTGAATLRCL